VDKIAFTGSTAVGKRIMAKAAPTLKRISLELGGKSPNVSRMLIWQQQWAVPSSVSTSTAVRFVKPVPVYCCTSRSKTSSCSSWSYQIRRSKGLTTTMGPVINERQFDRIQGYIQAGQTEGANC